MAQVKERGPYRLDHIEKRGERGLFFARLNVPAEVRAVIGRTRFQRALKTTDRVLARRLAAPIVANWQDEIEAARGKVVSRPAVLARPPEHWTPAYRKATPEQRKVMLEFIEDDAAEEVGLPFAHVANDPSGEATEQDRKEIEEYIAIATGERIATVEHLNEYLATLAGRLEQKSIDMKASSIRRFAEAFKHLSEVTRPAVQRWLNKLAAEGAASATVSRQLSEVRGYWKYLLSVAAVPEDARPFDHLTVPTSKRVKADQRQPFTAAEVSRLLGEARRQGDTDLVNVIELGRWTGARIEELGALRVDHVDLRERSITIGAAKSDAGVRVIPIHSKLLPLMRRLVKASKDGYVLCGQKPNKYGDRAGAVGHRFGRLKTALGFGERHVFHSIRKTVATQFENAHVLENIAAAILGHEFNTMSYGVYSGGPSLAVKRKAVERLRYPR